MMLALLVSAVLAHVPHDTVVAVAAPPGLDPELPWFLVADPYAHSLLLRSDDAGTDWLHHGGDPVGDDLLGAAMLDDGTLVVLAETRLWWLEDGEFYWEEPPGAPEAIVADGDRVLVLDDTGLWSWDPMGGFEAELLGPSLAILGVGPVVVDHDDEVWFTSDGAWTSVPAPADPGAVVLGDTAYLADLDGGVWRLDGDDWSACGALPAPEGHLSAEIRQLAWDGSRLLAAPGWKGPFASDTGCATWSDRAVPGVPGEDDFGQARHAAAVWRTFVASEDVWLIGGYFGLQLSEDAGLSWEEQPILSPAATRGLSFSSTFGSDQGVFWGTYAAGVAISHDDGDSFVAPSHGLGEGNVQDIRTSDNGKEHVITVIAGHVAYASRDAGWSWIRFEGLGGQVARIFPWDGGLEYWAIPYELDHALLESVDGGVTWAEPAALIEALDGAQPASAARCQGSCDGNWRCLTAVNPTSLLCSTDGGVSWETWYRDEEGDPDAEEQGRDAVTEPVLMPRDEPEVVIFGDPSGLHRITDRGATWEDTPIDGGDVPVELACAAGDHAFAATRSGKLLRSDDRGETWLELEPRLSSQATVMISSPGFIEEAHFLVANLDGVWELVDPAGDASLQPWTSWQRVDNHSGFVVKEGCPGSRADDAASMNSRQPLPRGCSMSLPIQGETLRILGITGPEGSARVLIDGVPTGQVPSQEVADSSVLAVLEGLEPGWHRVEIVGEGDDSLEIDAVEATDSAGFPEPALPDSRCGCGHGRRGSLAALLALVLVLLRRAAPGLRAAAPRTRSGRPSSLGGLRSGAGAVARR